MDPQDKQQYESVVKGLDLSRPAHQLLLLIVPEEARLGHTLPADAPKTLVEDALGNTDERAEFVRLLGSAGLGYDDNDPLDDVAATLLEIHTGSTSVTNMDELKAALAAKNIDPDDLDEDLDGLLRLATFGDSPTPNPAGQQLLDALMKGAGTSQEEMDAAAKAAEEEEARRAAAEEERRRQAATQPPGGGSNGGYTPPAVLATVLPNLREQALAASNILTRFIALQESLAVVQHYVRALLSCKSDWTTTTKRHEMNQMMHAIAAQETAWVTVLIEPLGNCTLRPEDAEMLSKLIQELLRETGSSAPANSFLPGGGAGDAAQRELDRLNGLGLQGMIQERLEPIEAPLAALRGTADSLEAVLPALTIRSNQGGGGGNNRRRNNG